jgi:diguanylate cyclase (GGDEF)-like protein
MDPRVTPRGHRPHPPVTGPSPGWGLGGRHGLAAAAGVAAVVALAGEGALVWLCLPPALVLAAATRPRLGAVLTGLLAAGLAELAAILTGAPGQPSPALFALVVAGSAAVLVSVRGRLQRERDLLRDYALSDPVTGVSNRRSLLIRADYEIERHRRARRSFALVMLDLDGFKQLNDRFGHAAGDDLLRDVAAALRRAMRRQDTVARFGGDEFCVLAPETDDRGSGPLADRVTTAVSDVSVGLEAVAGTVGVAIFPADGVTVADLMHAADVRLLEAKRRRPAGAGRRRAA